MSKKFFLDDFGYPEVPIQEYRKLEGLCGRIAELLKHAPILSIEHSPYATEYRETLDQWEKFINE